MCKGWLTSPLPCRFKAVQHEKPVRDMSVQRQTWSRIYGKVAATDQKTDFKGRVAPSSHCLLSQNEMSDPQCPFSLTSCEPKVLLKTWPLASVGSPP